MIITIDGPAASGKSTIAHLLAQKIGAFYINSGLLFRALAYILLQQKEDHTSLVKDTERLNSFLYNDVDYYYIKEEPLIAYKGHVITPLLKTPEVSSYASIIATEPTVRNVLLEYQRMLARHTDVIADGRDCGTVVFPHADFKFFITAQEAIRAQRFQHDLAKQNRTISLKESIALLQERDQRDSSRSTAPLEKAPDAFCIDTSFLSIEETVACVLSKLPKTVITS